MKDKLIKYKRIIIVFAILLFGVLSLSISETHAFSGMDRFSRGADIPGAYVWRNRPAPHPSGFHNFRESMHYIIRESDGAAVYCIEMGVPIYSSLWMYYRSSNQWGIIQQQWGDPTVLSQETWSTIVDIAYFGYGYGNRNTPIWYAVTQLMIWREIGRPNNVAVNFTYGFTNNINHQWDWKIDAIWHDINRSRIIPSFHNASLNMALGQTITLTDTNGVLGYFDVLSSPNLNVVRSGNNLSITATGTGNHEVRLRRLFNDEGRLVHPPIVYFHPTTQNMMSRGFSDPIDTWFNMRVDGGSITIDKVDNDTGLGVPLGMGSLANATYQILSYPSRTYVGTVRTNASGRAVLPNLELGRYIIRETIPSRGYLLDPLEHHVNITADNLHPSIISRQQIIRGRISISKRDLETNINIPQGEGSLAGAVYEVRNSANVLVATLVTDENGFAITGYLPYDDYTIREITPSLGYLIDPTIHQVSIRQNLNVYNRISLQQVIRGRIRVSKIDYENRNKVTWGDAVLSGAVYQVFNHRGELVDTIVTDANGYATTRSLPFGRYTIRELTASVGYLLDPETYHRTILINNSILEVTSPQQVIRRDIEFLKSYSQEATGHLVPEVGITFNIYLVRTGNLYRTVTTDFRGWAKIEGLPFGYYRVVQVNTGIGVERIEPFTFQVSYEAPNPIRFNMVNNQLSLHIRVFKTDNITGEVVPLAGIGFRIFNVDTQEYIWQTVRYPRTQILTVFRTNEDGWFMLPEALPVGNFRLEELDQPIYGYLWNREPLYFSIDDDTAFDNQIVFGNVKTLFFPNDRVTGRLEVIKYGQEPIVEDGTIQFTDIRLGGVTFNIYAAENIYLNNRLALLYGDLVGTITTNQYGFAYFDFLYLGRYRLVEISTADNHVLNEEPIYFEFLYYDQHTPVILVEVTVHNELETGTLEFTKTDIYGYSISNTLIRIYVEFEDYFHLIYVGCTNELGKIVLPDLPLNFRFRIVEERAAYGFILNEEPVYIELSYHDEIGSITMENEGVSGRLEVIKYGQVFTVENGSIQFTNIRLSGVTFNIYAAENIYFNNRLVHERNSFVGTITTDEYGFAYFDFLYLGRYRLVEISTADNHVLNEEPIYFEFLFYDQHTPVILVELTVYNELETGTLEFFKSDVDGKPIPYTLIRVYMEYEEYFHLIFVGYTNEYGKIIIDGLPLNVRFRIVEEEAAYGFILNEDHIYFELSYHDEILGITMINERIPEPEPIPVPDTYMSNSNIANAIGFLVIVGGMIYLVINKRRKK